MTFMIVDVPQRSPEWFAARCGLFTSSHADDLFKEGRKKGEESVGKRDLRVRLALESITQRSQDEDSFVTAAMQHGVETERTARLAYEAQTGELVQTAGFLRHTMHRAGTSLDGYVGEFEGVVEFKCPKSATHLENLRSRTVPACYLPQIRHHLWITGASWADFVSFDDRLPEPLQLCIVRVARSALDIEGYEKAALAFLADVEAEQQAILGLIQKAAA